MLTFVLLTVLIIFHCFVWIICISIPLLPFPPLPQFLFPSVLPFTSCAMYLSLSFSFPISSLSQHRSLLHLPYRFSSSPLSTYFNVFLYFLYFTSSSFSLQLLLISVLHYFNVFLYVTSFFLFLTAFPHLPSLFSLFFLYSSSSSFSLQLVLISLLHRF